jgi:DNA polymerase-3 subunit alpha
LLCENNEGYQNLIKLVSAGFTEGFYTRPRVDRELLEKYHDGLIALSACLAGEIPRAIMNGDYEKARDAVSVVLLVFWRCNKIMLNVIIDHCAGQYFFIVKIQIISKPFIDKS